MKYIIYKVIHVWLNNNHKSFPHPWVMVFPHVWEPHQLHAGLQGFPDSPRQPRSRTGTWFCKSLIQWAFMFTYDTILYLQKQVFDIHFG